MLLAYAASIAPPKRLSTLKLPTRPADELAARLAAGTRVQAGVPPGTGKAVAERPEVYPIATWNKAWSLVTGSRGKSVFRKVA